MMIDELLPRSRELELEVLSFLDLGTCNIAVCKKVRTGSKPEKELKVKKWEQLTQKMHYQS